MPVLAILAYQGTKFVEKINYLEIVFNLEMDHIPGLIFKSDCKCLFFFLVENSLLKDDFFFFGLCHQFSFAKNCIIFSLLELVSVLMIYCYIINYSKI